jgi:hypothetical protein
VSSAPDLFGEMPAAPKPPQPASPRFEGAAFVHSCSVCGSGLAPWGFGFSAKAGRLGTWFCSDHRPGKAGAG